MSNMTDYHVVARDKENGSIINKTKPMTHLEAISQHQSLKQLDVNGQLYEWVLEKIET